MDKEYWFVIIGAILSGAITFGGQIFANFGMSIVEISFLPFIFTLVILAPFVFLKKKYNINWKLWRVWLLFGLVSLPIGVGQFAAVKLGIPVAIVVLLLSTQPLWTLIFGKVFLKEKISIKKIIALILVLIGLYILISPKTSGNLNPWGIFFGLVAGLGLSGWTIVGNYASRIKNNNPVTVKFMEASSYLAIIIILYPLILYLFPNPEISRFKLAWPLIVWVALLLFALITQITAHILMFTGYKKVEASTAGIILLLEPISAAILAYVFLSQAITINIIIGGVIILAANYLVVTEKK